MNLQAYSSVNRKAECGPLHFSPEIENQFSEYVLNNSVDNDPNSVIKAADDFCWNNHWMMHVGDKKGAFLDKVIEEVKPTTVLELGTYCAYSTIRIARLLPNDGKIYTIDPKQQTAAFNLVQKAGLQNKIQIMTGSAEQIIPSLNFLMNSVDLVFIDHDKSKYLSDLKLIEDYNLLHENSCIIADNVGIFNINDYLSHVRNPGFYTSQNHLFELEYDDSNQNMDSVEVSFWKV